MMHPTAALSAHGHQLMEELVKDHELDVEFRRHRVIEEPIDEDQIAVAVGRRDPLSHERPVWLTCPCDLWLRLQVTKVLEAHLWQKNRQVIVLAFWWEPSTFWVWGECLFSVLLKEIHQLGAHTSACLPRDAKEAEPDEVPEERAGSFAEEMVDSQVGGPGAFVLRDHGARIVRELNLHA